MTLEGTAATPPTSGVLVVDKPRGPTSHDVVATVRRAMKTREVGHAGTLDPMATGVLLVAVGEATKLVPYLTLATKEYEARIELGRETDTLDAMGRVVEELPVDAELCRALEGPPSELSGRVKLSIAAELGRTSQVPPAFSAIQQGGERAYARARRGERVELEPRAVRVHRLVVTASGGAPVPWLSLSLKVDKGYYVRSFARDLGLALGTLGTLTALRRNASGSFTEGEAIDLAAVRSESPAAILARLIPLADAARRALPACTLTEVGAVAARFGQRVPRGDLLEPGGAAGVATGTPGEPCAWFDATGALVAVGAMEAGADYGRVVRGFGGR